jgi:hypothetical protein
VAWGGVPARLLLQHTVCAQRRRGVRGCMCVRALCVEISGATTAAVTWQRAARQLRGTQRWGRRSVRSTGCMKKQPHLSEEDTNSRGALRASRRLRTESINTKRGSCCALELWREPFWRSEQAAGIGSSAREASLQRLLLRVEWARCCAVRSALVWLQRPSVGRVPAPSFSRDAAQRARLCRAAYFPSVWLCVTAFLPLMRALKAANTQTRWKY